MDLVIYGGPPWGLRISNDEELRPVVGKLLPGGRAELNGLKVGDMILCVDGVTVGGTVEAQELIQNAKERLALRISRSIDGYHNTVRKEKLSTSNQNTPVPERKQLTTVSVPSTPVFPRTNPHFSRNSPVRQIKLDIQGIKGTTELKRRLFESEATKSPATDRLLQRKIQMGYMHGVPSESTTGYDSVCGDFAGGAQTSSNRTSPLSSLMQEEEIDERTIHEDHLDSKERTLSGSMNPHDANQMFGPAGSSQWEMKTENTNGKPADGEIEVPGRRSVAALRQAITNQLEMKAPIGSQARNNAGQELDGRNTPTYNRASVRVFEDSGIEENSCKPYFGRVLDGPVPENKYYQGVPPPSYSLCHSPAPSSCNSEPQYKPPISPKKESKGLRNSFLNRIATIGLKEEGEEDTEETNEGDGQTASDFYHSLYDQEGSQRTVNMIPEQSATRGPATLEDTVVISAKNPEDNTVIIASSSINNPRLVNDIQMTNGYNGETEKEYLRPVSSEISSVPEDPKSSTNSTSTSPRRISMDLESSDIFKSRSPAPFNAYSTNNTNHYATLRRNHSPVSLPYSAYSVGSAPIDENHNVPAPFSNNIMTTSLNSQKSENQDPRSTNNFMLQSQLFDRIFSDKNGDGDGDGVGSREPERCAAQEARPAPYSMDQLQYPGGKEDNLGSSMPSDGGSTHFAGPAQNEPDMSNWYRNMYKKMHKIDPETDSVLRHQQLRDQSPAPTISRPLTPSLHLQRPSSRFECELTPRRAKSVGRVIEPEEKEPASSNLADEIAELKRISKEELMFRQKAEKLTEELANEKQRRHGYIPSAAPSLQKNFDRFESLLNDYGGPSTTAKQPVEPPRNSNNSVVTATAVYQFVAKSPRELSLNKGDVVRIHREVDANWMEGERNGNAGIFPRSYVQINDLLDSNVIRLRVVYPFTARNSNELSLKLGEMLTYRRDIDPNWIEGANHLAEIGIFPKSYVKQEAEQMEPASSIIPDRPKTPKITTTAEPVFDIDYESPPREIRPSVHFQSDDQQEIIRRSIEASRELYEKRKQEIVHQIFEDLGPAPAAVGPSFERSRPADSRPAGMAQFVEPRGNEPPRRQEAPQPRFDDFAAEPAVVGPSFDRSRPTHSRPAGMAQFVPKGSETFRAVYPYRPQKEDELELELDDIIFVVEKCDDGWFIGTLLRNGKFGTFPGNYVQRH